MPVTDSVAPAPVATAAPTTLPVEPVTGFTDEPTVEAVPATPRIEVVTDPAAAEQPAVPVVPRTTVELTPDQIAYLQAVEENARKAAQPPTGGLPAEWVPAKPDDPWYTEQMAAYGKVGICIIKHESATQGGPVAQNKTSTASGLFQIVVGTWKGYAGVGRAKYATPTQQWERFFQVYNGGRGIHNWDGTHCAGAK